MSKEKQYEWGDYLKPTKECIDNLQLDPETRAFCVGISRDGKSLRLLLKGQRTISDWTPEYWKPVEINKYNEKKYLKIKSWHSDDCLIVNTEEENYFPSGEMFFGNFAGNENKQGNSYYWIEIGCNEVGCKFRAVVEMEYLNNFIKQKKYE